MCSWDTGEWNGSNCFVTLCCFRFLALGTNLFNYSALRQALVQVLSSFLSFAFRTVLQNGRFWSQRIYHKGFRHLHPAHQRRQGEDLPGALAHLCPRLPAQSGASVAPGTLGGAFTQTLYCPSPVPLSFGFSPGDWPAFGACIVANDYSVLMPNNSGNQADETRLLWQHGRTPF